jgi:hypothetical protein
MKVFGSKVMAIVFWAIAAYMSMVSIPFLLSEFREYVANGGDFSNTVMLLLLFIFLEAIFVLTGLYHLHWYIIEDNQITARSALKVINTIKYEEIKTAYIKRLYVYNYKTHRTSRDKYPSIVIAKVAEEYLPRETSLRHEPRSSNSYFVIPFSDKVADMIIEKYKKTTGNELEIFDRRSED